MFLTSENEGLSYGRLWFFIPGMGQLGISTAPSREAF